jgi:hypothetical protein
MLGSREKEGTRAWRVRDDDDDDDGFQLVD